MFILGTIHHNKKGGETFLQKIKAQHSLCIYVHKNPCIIQNSFDVHIIFLMSVLSLMPKGKIVGIKLLFPLVTTLSFSSYSSHRAFQYKPSSHSIYRVTIGHMKINNVYCVMQYLPSTSDSMIEIQCLPNKVQQIVSTE